MWGLWLFLFCIPVFLFAGEEAAPIPGDELTLKVAVIGPGDELYFWWGHLGLIIENSLDGTSLFYDYGIFSFENVNFFSNFAFGRLLYTCGVSRSAANIGYYLATNRDITLYTLDLPPEAKLEAARFAQWNVRPENKDYFYHHFRDNCVSRIRDIIDMTTGGQFKEQYGQAPGRYTLRQHVRRHTWFSPIVDWLLNFWMGQGIDSPIAVWDEMFLPSEFGLRIAEFSRRGPDGVSRPLVSNIQVVNRAKNRPGVLDVPPRFWFGDFFAGLLLALVFLFLSYREKQGRVLARRCLGLLQALTGLLFGLAGSLLFFMSFFTDHDYTYHNSNILFVNPLLLAALPLGLCLAFSKKTERRSGARRRLKLLFTYVRVFCLVTIVIRLLPGLYQQNQPVQALILPFSLALSYFPQWLSAALRRIRGLAHGS
jgi:hypothetical protein